VELRDCRAVGAEIAEAWVAHARIARCRMDYAGFGRAKLESVRFEDCDLKEASFSGCRFKAVEFDACVLTAAEFRTRRSRASIFGPTASNGINLSAASCAAAVFAGAGGGAVKADGARRPLPTCRV
jgi:uncharacterized protein YjbI with pentapeptide repeats